MKSRSEDPISPQVNRNLCMHLRNSEEEGEELFPAEGEGEEAEGAQREGEPRQED